VKRKARPSQQARPPTAARVAFEAGTAADRWDKWVVDRVLEVHRPREGTRAGAVAGQLRVRLRWQGKDPATGLSWPDTWEALYEIKKVKGKTRKLLTVNSNLLVAVRAMEAAKYGTVIIAERGKRKARPCEDTAQAKVKKLKKWIGVLRSVEGATEAEYWWQVRRRVRCHGSIEREEEAGSQAGVAADVEALRDLRRQRAGTRGRVALERERRKRRVLDSDMTSSD
jgi:hypothetical protein